MIMKGFDTENPLLAYATDHLWGNPEENHQYQVHTVRLSDYYGDTDNFQYMNKWRTLPKKDTFYYVFSVQGLDPGYWNFRTNVLRRNPLDRWVNFSDLCKRRGIQLDIYNTKGYKYALGKSWMMTTYDGLTFIALEKSKTFPMPTGAEMFFRCYTPSVPVARNEQVDVVGSNPFGYETMVYENPQELQVFTARYQFYKAQVGFTGVLHNGAYYHGAPNTIPGLAVGDVVEIFHDPTVIRAEIYAYKNLKDFYSEMDKKRKLIIHPPKRPGDFTIRYFDDNDYYLLGKTPYGLYFNRNDVTAIRQLTHVDVSIADDRIQMMSEYHPALKKVADIRILVLVRKTEWEYQWPHEHQRIRYLYRFNDTDILRAMTGDRATVPEWTAANLEQGPVMSFTRKQYKDLDRVGAHLAMGYNAATRALSESPMRTDSRPGARGIEVPISYRENFTAWEYDAKGQLIDYWNLINTRYFTPRNTRCAMVEFTSGEADRELEYIVTNKPIQINPVNDVRVYTSFFNIDLQVITGELTDVTGDDSVYKIVDGTLNWTDLDTVNQRGIILFNTKSLCYTFELDHIDKSLSFAITEIYEGGGLIFPLAFANIDLFLNGHPLIDNVDWVFDGQRCYIFNKEFLKAGAQTITFRGHQFSVDMTRPKQETELGYVDGGVIGRMKRYNLREDRVTRTVINGALYMTDEVPNAENQSPDDPASLLNGKPYMVKHVYCPTKYVEPYDNFPGYAESRAVDQRVSDYMTLYLPKPSKAPVLPNLQDKYRLFSPFLSVVVNAILNRLLPIGKLPTDATGYSEQFIRDSVGSYLWWLKYDPVILNFDRRYFAIMPFANYGKVTVTSSELIFIKQVNDSYLNGVCAIEGHFEVNNNVR